MSNYSRNRCSGGGTSIITLNNLFLNFFGIAGGWPGNETYPFNGPAWSLGVEIFCYIIFYFLIKLIHNKKVKNIIIILLIISGLYAFKFNLNYPIINCEMGRGIASFFLGGAIYKLLINFKWKKRTSFILLILLGGSILLLKFNSFISQNLYFMNVLVIFPILLLITLNSKFINNLLKNKFINKLSKLSYSIYLNQLLIMETIYLINLKYNFINFYSPLFFIIYLIITLLFSYLTYTIIELKLKNYLMTKIKFRQC